VLVAALSMAAGVVAADTPLERGSTWWKDPHLRQLHTPRVPAARWTWRGCTRRPADLGDVGVQVKGRTSRPTGRPGIGAGALTGAARHSRRRAAERPAPLAADALWLLQDLHAVRPRGGGGLCPLAACVSSKVPASVYKVGRMHVEIPPGADQPMPESAMKDPVKRGFYLVTIGHCMECHSPRADGRSDLSALGKGGERSRGRGA